MTLLLSLLLGPSALAFAPSDDIHIGIEPTRVLTTTPDGQRRMRRAAAWQDFLAGEGAGWLARFDEQAGTVYRAWGAGLDLGPLESEAQVEAALRALFDRYPGLIAVDGEELALASAGYVPRSQTWAVQFDRLVDGLPIWRGGVRAIFRYGKLVMLDVATHPRADAVDTTPSFSGAEAVDIAITRGPEPDREHRLQAAELMILPLDRAGLEYRLVYEVRTATGGEPPGLWVSHVDAHTGELLNVYNGVRFLTGTIQAVHDTRTVDGSYSTSVVPYATVSNGEAETQTDGSGVYTLDETDAGFSTILYGDYFRVENASGPEGAGAWTDADFTWDTTYASQAEIDTFIFLEQVRQWALIYAPGVPEVTTTQLRSNVNIQSGSCNAYWSGTVNFYAKAGVCNNTGRIADVNYHEWGHGLHYYSLITGVYDGSMGEGIGDVTALLQTDDSLIAPYFYTTGGGIRDADNTMRYPDDYGSSVHSNGTIFSGSNWDLLAGLELSLGSRDDARAVVSQLFADGIKLGPDVPGSYDAYVAADDDDGDLSNGTPHQCELLDAFGLHGIGPGGGGAVLELQHEPVWSATPWEDHPVSVDVINFAPDCVEVSTENALVYYSTDGETWESAPLSAVDEVTLEGAIPEQPDGSVVWYYFELTDDSGDVFTAPSGGYINPFSFFVGEVEEVYCEGFEDDDGGYTHELVSGEASSGADDWHWGSPAGKSTDPAAAWDGVNIWGNDLGNPIDGNQYNGDYQAEKHNRLISVPIDVSAAADSQLVLQFARMLSVEDGYYDQALVTLDGETIWSNYTSGVGPDYVDHHLDAQWGPHTQLIEDADGDGAITLTWELISDRGLEYGGWNIDDVCVYAWQPTPEPEVIDTGAGEDTGGADTGGADTGGVVEDDPGEDTGGSAGGVDTDGLGGEDDPADTSDVDLAGKGCGCASTGSGPVSPLGGLAAVALGALALVRRRE